MKKTQKQIDLGTLAGGAFSEKLNDALMEVAANIQNQNTDATAKRGITINIKFAPNKTRQLVSTQITVTTKLAATEAIDTQMIMGVNMKTGEIEVAEYGGAQMEFDMEEPEEETEEAPEQTSAEPLDLKNRHKATDTEENNNIVMLFKGKTAQA